MLVRVLTSIQVQYCTAQRPVYRSWYVLHYCTVPTCSCGVLVEAIATEGMPKQGSSCSTIPSSSLRVWYNVNSLPPQTQFSHFAIGSSRRNLQTSLLSGLKRTSSPI